MCSLPEPAVWNRPAWKSLGEARLCGNVGRWIDGLAAAQPEGSFLRNKTPARNTCAYKCLLPSLGRSQHWENEHVYSMASNQGGFLACVKASNQHLYWVLHVQGEKCKPRVTHLCSYGFRQIGSPPVSLAAPAPMDLVITSLLPWDGWIAWRSRWGRTMTWSYSATFPSRMSTDLVRIPGSSLMVPHVGKAPSSLLGSRKSLTHPRSLQWFLVAVKMKSLSSFSRLQSQSSFPKEFKEGL